MSRASSREWIRFSLGKEMVVVKKCSCKVRRYPSKRRGCQEVLWQDQQSSNLLREAIFKRQLTDAAAIASLAALAYYRSSSTLYTYLQIVLLHNREKERTKKLLKFLRDFQDTRDKKKEFATNNVQQKVVYTTLRTRIQSSSGDSFLQSADSLFVES